MGLRRADVGLVSWVVTIRDEMDNEKVCVSQNGK